MSRILLLLPTGTYRARDFLAAAARLGVDVVVGSEHRQAMAARMGDRSLVVPLENKDEAVEAIVKFDARAPLDAVLAVDDRGQEIAAEVGERLGLRHNVPEAVASTRDKARMRDILARAAVDQPAYRVVVPGGDVVAAAAELGYPCVIKPVSRSGSQGVIRVDDPREAERAGARIGAILGSCVEPLLVERFVEGAEVAVEGLLRGGELTVLAVFDKPDPLDGPFFEETIYVTPSRQPSEIIGRLEATAGRAAAALGLREGPVHVELRIGPSGTVTLLELASRSIGGLCARSLRFGADVSLEELIIRQAIDLGLEGLEREAPASGVMMLPIRSGGMLEGVFGRDRALAVEGVAGIEISIATGKAVVPLPEGDRYLGFVFARGPTAEFVEDALRRAEACLEVRVQPAPG